jgi:hypothetical protein
MLRNYRASLEQLAATTRKKWRADSRAASIDRSRAAFRPSHEGRLADARRAGPENRISRLSSDAVAGEEEQSADRAGLPGKRQSANGAGMHCGIRNVRSLRRARESETGGSEPAWFSPSTEDSR